MATDAESISTLCASIEPVEPALFVETRMIGHDGSRLIAAA